MLHNRNERCQVNEITAILSTLTDLLGLQLDQYVYIGQLFNYIKPLAAIPSAWLVDKFGIRHTMYLALVLTLLRNCSRALLFSPQLSGARWQQLKFLYWTLSSISESLVIVLYFTCLPLKVSESWFPQEERSFAWSSIYIVPFMGASVAAALLPRLVARLGSRSIHVLAELNLFCLLASVLVVILAVDRSRPEEAPSERSRLAERQLRRRASFFADLKNVLNFQIILQLVTMCTFEAMNASIKSLWQDVLASLGLSSVFCGNLLAVNSLVMIVVQLLASWRMDRRPATHGRSHSTRQDAYSSNSIPIPIPKTRSEVKLLVCCQWLTFMLQLASLSLGEWLGAQQSWLLVVCILVHSSMSCWSAPHYNDTLANLIVGRLSQATISAVRLSVYILLSNPYQSAFVYLRQVEPSADSPDRVRVSYTLSMAFAALMITSVSVVYVACFSDTRRRQDDDHDNIPEPQQQDCQ